MQLILPSENALPADSLKEQIERAGLSYQQEFRFYTNRQWRFDFAFPDQKIAVEVEGGIHLTGRRQSRHTRGTGFEDDCQKYNIASIFGWRVLRVTPGQIQAGLAMTWILLALGIDSPEPVNDLIQTAPPRKRKKKNLQSQKTVVIGGRELKVKSFV